MKGSWACLLSVIVLASSIASSAAYSAPPFPIALELEKTQSEELSLAEIVSKFRALVHTYPYLLDRYLRTGDVSTVYEINENTDSLDRYLRLMRKAVANNEQKEMFAKLMAGAQKLKENVQSNLIAIDRYRMVNLVFTKRSSRLVEWLRLSALKLTRRTPHKKTSSKKDSALTLLYKVNAEVLKAIFATRLSLRRPEDESERTRAKSLWQTAIKVGNNFASSASAPEEKELYVFLNPTLKSLEDQTTTLFVRTDELQRAWESTLSQIHSLEELLVSGDRARKPVAPADAKTPSRPKK
jgi:hypothetical protein